jgi:glycosyltransferase involved in cell wall biosynthesis
MENPSFSIVVPTFNGARFLLEALDSVTAQTLQTWECLIVDDGSIDNSYEIASNWASTKKASARVFRRPQSSQRGVAATRNLAIRESSSEWIAFLDQDDIWKPSKLEEQAQFIRLHPEFAVIGCLPEIRFEGTSRSPFIENWEAMIFSIDEEKSMNLRLKDFIAACPYCMSGVVARKSSVLEVGGFDNSISRISDWKTWACLASRGPLAFMRSILVTYRLHGDNELLNLQSEPLGIVDALLTLRSHMVDWMVKEQSLTSEEASSRFDEILQQEGLAWLRQKSQTNSYARGVAYE